MAKRQRLLAVGALGLIGLAGLRAQAPDPRVQDTRLVRLAEIEVDPAQVAAYQAALKQEIEASLRLEPGVLALLAVAVKDHPEQIRLFETYRDEAAYRAHLETPHFKRYKVATAQMVKSLKLVETEPILLGSKLR
jgi:quinol monooxygenase YgiN